MKEQRLQSARARASNPFACSSRPCCRFAIHQPTTALRIRQRNLQQSVSAGSSALQAQPLSAQQPHPLCKLLLVLRSPSIAITFSVLHFTKHTSSPFRLSQLQLCPRALASASASVRMSSVTRGRMHFQREVAQVYEEKARRQDREQKDGTRKRVREISNSRGERTKAESEGRQEGSEGVAVGRRQEGRSA